MEVFSYNEIGDPILSKAFCYQDLFLFKNFKYNHLNI